MKIVNKYPPRLKIQPGQKFNYLTTVRRLPSKRRPCGSSYTAWLCQCDCGNIKEVESIRLVNNRIKSCGCKQYEHWFKLTPEDLFLLAAKRIGLARSKAKLKNRIFALDTPTCLQLLTSKCHYCHVSPERFLKPYLTKRQQERYAQMGEIKIGGIDRVDSARGYEQDNVVSCCFTCNRAKGDMSHDEFIKWIKRISQCDWF